MGVNGARGSLLSDPIMGTLALVSMFFIALTIINGITGFKHGYNLMLGISILISMPLCKIIRKLFFKK